MAATGASGTNAVRYGTMKDNVLNLEVVLADGHVIETSGLGMRARKSSAGFNLTQLFVGSEGTLGIITKLRLKLHPLPNETAVAVISFDTNRDAISCVINCLANSLRLARIEFLDEKSIQATVNYSQLTNLEQKPTLFIEVHCFDQQEVDTQLKTLQEIADSNNLRSFQVATTTEQRTQLWKARHDLYYACKALDRQAELLTTDVCVPITQLPAVIDGANELFEKANLVAPLLGHVGDGNFHATVLVRHEQFAKAKDAANQLGR